MKNSLVILALSVISSANLFAGQVTVPSVPDAGASVLFLSIGLAALGVARKFRR